MFHNSQTIQGSFQRRHPANRAVALLAVLALFACADWAGVARAEDRSQVSGEILRIDGLRVLRVWGAPRERGFAHGYLLAEDIIKLLDGYLAEAEVTGGVEAYWANLPRLPKRFVLEPPYEAELRGIAEGIAARLGDRAVVPILGRRIGYEDLLAINCIPDSARMGCSSFAAWGTMTANGETISGRNLDWHRIKALYGTGIAIVNLASTERGPTAWVSITWPGFVGCLTGMNSDGLTIAMHDVPSTPPPRESRFTPRGFALRFAIEFAKSGKPWPEGGIEWTLMNCKTCVGNCVPVSFPYVKGEDPPSCVFEYDTRLNSSEGVSTLRSAWPGFQAKPFMIATNHFQCRGKPLPCSRFYEIEERLLRHLESNKRLAVSGSFEILRSVACRGGDNPLETYQSVVFEPNKRLMHVAFSADGKPAADCRPVTLKLAKLLAPRPQSEQTPKPASRPLAAQPAGR